MKKIKLLCDPMLALLGFITPLSCTMLTVSTFILLLVGDAEGDVYECIALFGGLLIVFDATCLYCAPRWFAYVVLNKDSICLHKGFKKAKEEKYEDFPYFKIASYVHIFSTRYFVVLGKKGLSMQELVNINHVPVSEEIIKIKLNKKSYAFLMECLPEYQKNILRNAMGGGFKDATAQSKKYAAVLRRKEKERKRKSKWKKKKQ